MEPGRPPTHFLHFNPRICSWRLSVERRMTTCDYKYTLKFTLLTFIFWQNLVGSAVGQTPLAWKVVGCRTPGPGGNRRLFVSLCHLSSWICIQIHVYAISLVLWAVVNISRYSVFSRCSKITGRPQKVNHCRIRNEWEAIIKAFQWNYIFSSN